LRLAALVMRPRQADAAIPIAAITKLMTALVVLDLIARSGKSIDELTADLKLFPQVIVNVKVRERKPLESIPTVATAIRAAEEALKDTGRVVIRYSGTEPLVRVMIEAESEAAMRLHADAIQVGRRIGLVELGDKEQGNGQPSGELIVEGI